MLNKELIIIPHHETTKDGKIAKIIIKEMITTIDLKRIHFIIKKEIKSDKKEDLTEEEAFSSMTIDGKETLEEVGAGQMNIRISRNNNSLKMKLLKKEKL